MNNLKQFIGIQILKKFLNKSKIQASKMHGINIKLYKLYFYYFYLIFKLSKRYITFFIFERKSNFIPYQVKYVR